MLPWHTGQIVTRIKIVMMIEMWIRHNHERCLRVYVTILLGEPEDSFRSVGVGKLE